MRVVVSFGLLSSCQLGQQWKKIVLLFFVSSKKKGSKPHRHWISTSSAAG